MAGTVNAIAQILLTGLQMYEGYIEDPKRRLEARLKTKEALRLQLMEYLKKETTGDEADTIAHIMLDIVRKL